MTTVWDKAKSVKLNVDDNIEGNLNIYFDSKIPVALKERLTDIVEWLESNYSFPITLYVDFEYKSYLISRQNKRVGYLFHFWEFDDYPNFDDDESVPEIRLAVKEDKTGFEGITVSFFTAISYYFAWILHEDLYKYNVDDDEVDYMVTKYLECENVKGQVPCNMVRPELSIETDSEVFRQFYYLKEELVGFCKANGLQTTGSKAELTERITVFLNTGERLKKQNSRSKTAIPLEITPDTLIEQNFVCSERHREFFKSQIGSTFTFNVLFQKWLKANSGKTYRDAIAAYKDIMAQKKSNKSDIGEQFEYNTYIRDFFADNQGRTLQDAITCWKYKKSSSGHNRYESSDLIALD